MVKISGKIRAILHFTLFKSVATFFVGFSTTRKLSKILNRNSNNLDIFRVIAAIMVIYGHSYAISPQAGHSDFIFRWLAFDYSGSLAVKLFFFLSGLVVTNSLLEKRNPLQFIVARFFRIWPALFFVSVISALLLGLMLSNLSLHEYFSHGQVYGYIYKNVILKIAYNLPGVFVDNPYKKAVNGSLWTIPYEVFAYAFLLALFMIGVFKRRGLAILIFIVMLIDPLVGNKLLFTWLPVENHEVNLLAPCFAFGALLAIYKDKVNISVFLIAGAWMLFILFKDFAYNFYFFYLAAFISIVYLSSLDAIVKLKPRIDISYGIYLWGFPVQQIIAHLFYSYGIRFNQFFSILICTVLGCASWYLIEKRCIKLGVKIGKKLSVICLPINRETRADF